METGGNQREFTRAEHEVAAEVRGTQGKIVRGKVRDLSLNGLYIVTDRQLPAGSECWVTIRLKTGKTDLHLRAHGTVIRCGAAGMAIEFSDIQGDSFEHLKKLVLFNASDRKSVEEEFEEHLGIHRRP